MRLIAHMGKQLFHACAVKKNDRKAARRACVIALNACEKQWESLAIFSTTAHLPAGESK
ncbi:hypothetical protein [Rhizobium sullae]|uniref:hypothetical protein n=1 Tax=Rhizobium sullae TaxID=50338 RepID=UPI0018E287A4|nr:hypothetical protein [Rhizobium sullae]